MLHISALPRSSFWVRITVGAALVGLADLLFFTHTAGTSLGLYAFAVVGGALFGRKDLLRDRRGLGFVLAGAAFALVLADRPGFLAWALFVVSMSLGALSSRVGQNETAWGWTQRLALHWLFTLFGPVVDLFKVSRLRRGRGGMSALSLLGLLVMPVVGGAVFLALFSAANPLISNALANLSLPSLSPQNTLRVLFWCAVFIGVLALLRPRWRKPLLTLPERKIGKPSAFLTRTITLSLIVFNAVFALQNGLDIAFLWSGAPLPGDMGLADYAHRGAYPLIVTALLAGLFVLVALQPGSDTAQRPLVRRLVVVWIAQNMVLVASSLLRTADYIEAYALTRFRIAAMIWMVLVAVGLMLICWRMLAGKSAHWLINANAMASLIVLAVVSVVDLGAVVAGWNVRHAREVGGRGVELDLGYLHTLGAPALVSLVELETTLDDAVLRDRVAAVRQDILLNVRRRQDEWRGWTWRDQRRLDRIDALQQKGALSAPSPGARDWDGRLIRTAPPSAPAPTPVSAPAPVASPPSVPLTSRTEG
ncbi:hypothetical protein GCM10017620_24930 [Brevundimonas intermedia]|uniref:DUF4173 domain-containing protein n=1 Tax=Brevundimonas intermedia TaxID=74315 RepID=A0ABQ5TBV8_9CAUL|nr:DUF4173 domain-containing protein [Brevundimonas intermedia]GLK49520.1 hypothetical protein GCM10017620_24930 [Brevundimonas intermedia]